MRVEGSGVFKTSAHLYGQGHHNELLREEGVEAQNGGGREEVSACWLLLLTGHAGVGDVGVYLREARILQTTAQLQTHVTAT